MALKDFFRNRPEDEDFEGYDEAGYGDIYDEPEFAQNDGQQPTMGIGSSSSALELKVVKPERFDCVPQIADHLINHRTVVLNLEATNKETARRLIDFLSGVAYSINGQLKRVANNTYVITPANVDVSGEQIRDDKAQSTAEEYEG